METASTSSSSTVGPEECSTPWAPAAVELVIIHGQDITSVDQGCVWKLAADGDLHLVVKSETKRTHTFLVRAATVAGMSPAGLVRDALQDGKAVFMDDEMAAELPITSTAQSPASDTQQPQNVLPRIILPCEHSRTLFITLIVAHGRPWVLPSAVGFELLDALAEHCTIFGTRQLVSEVILPWVELLTPQAVSWGDLRWLRIGWAFWLDCIYEAQLKYWYVNLADKLVTNVR
jgi:hypothetical protein